ncbi:hypothetical protein LCGC14_2720850 [marine sediment metagenome]|uniref:Uncharacterized protein n=1 Tax=marine sediment metagenome TaxID=412755 RepID=A0A0F8ZA82_9ZZZZ
MGYAQGVKCCVAMTAFVLACSCVRAEDERVLFSGFEKDRLLKWTKVAGNWKLETMETRGN